MDYKELFEKYKILLNEVNRLAEENSQLKTQIGLTKSEFPRSITSALKPGINSHDSESANSGYFSDINNNSDSLTKINLFMSLFKGRDDVYAKHGKITE